MTDTTPTGLDSGPGEDVPGTTADRLRLGLVLIGLIGLALLLMAATHASTIVGGCGGG